MEGKHGYLLHNWRDVLQIDQNLVTVAHDDESGNVAVSSEHLFLQCPFMVPKLISESLFLIEVWITPTTGGQPIL